MSTLPKDFVSRVGLLLTLGQNALGPLGWMHWPMPLPIITNVAVVAGGDFETEILIHWLAQNPQDIQQASTEEIELLRSVLVKEGLLEGWVKSNIATLCQFRETISNASSPTAAWTKMADDKKFGSYSHIRSITRGVNDKFNDQIRAAATQITYRYNSI